jgi:hypothetical protein
MRIKQPKELFRASNERRPKQDIPTEAARLKARMARRAQNPAPVVEPKPEPNS